MKLLIILSMMSVAMKSSAQVPRAIADFTESPIDYSSSKLIADKVTLNEVSQHTLMHDNPQTTLSDYELDELLKNPSQIDNYEKNILHDPVGIDRRTKTKMDLMKQVFQNEGCRFIAQLENNKASEELRALALKYIELKRQVERAQKPILKTEDDSEVKMRSQHFEAIKSKHEDHLRDVHQKFLEKLKARSYPQFRERDLAKVEKFEDFLNAAKSGGAITNPSLAFELSKISESDAFTEYDHARENYYPYVEHVKIRNKNQEEENKRAIKKYTELLADPKMKHILDVRKFTDKELEVMAQKEEIRLLQQKEGSQFNKDVPLYPMPKNIVISFEGTANYSPVQEKRMKILNALVGQEPSPEKLEKVSAFLNDNHTDTNVYNGAQTWPGILRGPINNTITSNDISKKYTNKRDSQWLYFPSEMQGHARDIAMMCLKAYLENIAPHRPQITVVGHSSGAYSAIQFSKELQDNNIDANLLTVDPIKPAHIAALDILATKVGHEIPFVPEQKCEDKYYESTSDDIKFETKRNPDLHYKNFFQKDDLLGFGDAHKWGLRGTYIKGMDNQQKYYPEDFTVDKSSHGAIIYSKEVIDTFSNMLD